MFFVVLGRLMALPEIGLPAGGGGAFVDPLEGASVGGFLTGSAELFAGELYKTSKKQANS